MTIVGTRPEIIRLSRVVDKLDRHCTHVLVHTGQNYDYELNEVFFNDLGIRKPDAFLNAAGATAAQTIGQVIIAADRVLEQHQPDALLLLGDTNSCLAAIAAKRRKVPIFHMEAGNRCFDFRVPEEINRRIVDHTSDINLTYSQIAREYLLREGLPPDQVICTEIPRVVQQAAIGVPNVTIVITYPDFVGPTRCADRNCRVIVDASAPFVPLPSQYMLGGAFQITLKGGSQLVIQR